MMRRQRNNDEGFTLAELLVAVAIVGVLAAIGIPQYARYREKARDSLAQYDLRNAATAEEAYYATELRYVSGALVTNFLPGFVLSSQVSGSMAADNGAIPSFTGTSTASGGTGKVFSWDSALGGMTN
jgi:prepilin-type N-terminal cleavage/methylation domain-containing protein